VFLMCCRLNIPAMSQIRPPSWVEQQLLYG
jgi:hypothetical protein